jgi:tetratricopeptide (TPR) repeat protein
VLKHAGREKEAEDAYRTSIALYAAAGDATGQAAYPMDNLGVLVGEQGRYAEASALEAAALAVARKHLPPEHPDILDFEMNQAGALMGQHATAQAEPLLRHVVEARARVLGPEHKDALMAVVELVDCLIEQRRYAEAAKLGRPAAEGLQKALGFEHGVSLYGWNVYATAACQTDQAADGLDALRRVEAAREKLYGAGDWHAPSTRVGIGTCLVTLGRYPEAEVELLEAVRGLESARGPSFHRTQAAYQALRDLCSRQGRADDAGRWAAKVTTP